MQSKKSKHAMVKLAPNTLNVEQVTEEIMEMDTSTSAAPASSQENTAVVPGKWSAKTNVDHLEESRVTWLLLSLEDWSWHGTYR